MGYLIKKDPEQAVPEIIRKLEESGIAITGKNKSQNLMQLHTQHGIIRLYSSKKGTTIDDTFYKKDDLPEILGIEELNKDINIITEDVIGIDESGKGDYFGPLVVAGVYVKDSTRLSGLGLKDSKKISDKKAIELCQKIKKLSVVEVLKITPETYNKLYSEIKNLNSLLAWAHAKVIDNLAYTGAKTAISDKFGHERLIRSRIKSDIRLIQKTKAETNIAVAAASIVARAEFLLELQKYSFELAADLPKGAGYQVTDAGRRIVEKYGEDVLKKIAKLHFRTTQQILMQKN